MANWLLALSLADTGEW